MAISRTLSDIRRDFGRKRKFSQLLYLTAHDMSFDTPVGLQSIIMSQ